VLLHFCDQQSAVMAPHVQTKDELTGLALAFVVRRDVGDVRPHKGRRWADAGPTAVWATEAGVSAREATRGRVGPRATELCDRHGAAAGRRDLQFRR
jgi:hypothetical protein